MTDEFSLTDALADEDKRIRKEERAARTPEYSEPFGEFWARYPRKTGKATAWKSWAKLKLDDKPDTCLVIQEDLRRRESTGWFESRGKSKTPHPSTYLNQQRWEDEDIESEIDEEELKKRRPVKARPQPPVVERREREVDMFRAKCSILWMELVKYFIGTRGLEITEERTRECWEAMTTIVEPYRVSWESETDQSQSAWEALMTDMLNTVWKRWMEILKLGRHRIMTVEKFKEVIAGVQATRRMANMPDRSGKREADAARALREKAMA